MRLVGILLLRWAFVASSLGIAAAIVPAVDISGFWGLVWTSALFGVVNVVVGPLLRLVALPLTVLTFGLFGLVVNGLLLALTAWLSDALDVGGFVQTMLAALIITLIASAAQFMLYGSTSQHAGGAHVATSGPGTDNKR
jgi:putative membrane protein